MERRPGWHGALACLAGPAAWAGEGGSLAGSAFTPSGPRWKLIGRRRWGP
jgi:hypothetical protein